jgi:hypothetical protein
MTQIGWAVAVTVGVAVCALAACDPESSSRPTWRSQPAGAGSESPVPSGAAAEDPEKLLLTREEVNAIDNKVNPGTDPNEMVFSSSDRSGANRTPPGKVLAPREMRLIRSRLALSPSARCWHDQSARRTPRP